MPEKAWRNSFAKVSYLGKVLFHRMAVNGKIRLIGTKYDIAFSIH